MRVIKEDFGCIGETFLCAFQILHSSKIKSATPEEKLRAAFITMKIKQGKTAEEAQAELDNTANKIEMMVKQLNDKVQDEICKHQHKYDEDQ